MGHYEKNIEALEKHHPKLVELIDSCVIDEERIKVLNAESDEMQVVYKKEDGQDIYILGDKDQTNAANQAVDLLGKMKKEGIAVLFGFGLGFFAEEILKRFEKGHLLIVYEATPSLFKTALMTRDLSELLGSEKIKVILGDDAHNFADFHNHYHHIVHGKFWIVKHNPSIKLNEEAYENFHKRLLEENRLSNSGIGTMISLGKDFINSFMSNIPQLIRKSGVNRLKDIFRGRPAIVVSAGPSLEKNFHLLKKAKGRAIIIAVDVVLPTLLPAGIIPDIIVAIDPLPENIAVFRDNPMLKEVPFICLAQYTPEIVDIYPGPIFINSVPGNVIFQWLNNFWEDKGYIECFGGSVAHLAFASAEYMGAKDIALIGQDLSYEKKFHSGDTTELLHAFHDQETPDYTRGAQKADNIFGEKRYTVGALLSFKTHFENRIRTFNGTAINATEGGLPIEGARTMRLADFIDEHCDLEEIDTFPVLSGLNNSEISYNLEGLLFQVTNARSMFVDIRGNAKKILKHIHRAQKMKKKKEEEKPEFHNILEKIETLTEKVKSPILDIIASYHYQLELYMRRQGIQDIDEIEDKWKKLKKQLIRGLNYYGELIEAIDLFVKQLDKIIKAIKREVNVNKLLMDDSLPKYSRFLKTGKIYKRAGIADRAVKYLEASIRAEDTADEGREMNGQAFVKTHLLNASKSQITSLYVPLAEMYIKQFRFYEAREILTKAGRQKARSKQQAQKVPELLKTCDEKIRAWDERKKKVEKLLKKAEADYGSNLDSGYFYFRAKDYEMAEKAYEKVISDQTSETSSQNPASAAYYGLAHTYLAMEETEKAVSALEKAIEADPENPILYRDLGFIAIGNKNLTAAEAFLVRAIELSPQTEELYKPLASLYLSSGETEKAVALYEDALLVIPDSPIIQRGIAVLFNESVAQAAKAGKC